MSEPESNPVDSGQGNFNPQGVFTDTGDANLSLIRDIEKVTTSTSTTLPDHLIQSAKEAGELL